MLTKVLNSSLFKNSGIYIFASIVNSGISFLLLPVFTRYLTPQAYGIVTMYSLMLSITGIFTGLNVNGAISREWFNRDKIDFKSYIGNCIIILFSSTILTGIIFFLFLNLIAKYSDVPKNWLLTIVLISFFQFITLSLLAVYRSKMKAISYNIIMLGQTIMNVILSVILVAYLNMGWQGRITGQIVAIALTGFISFYILSKYWIKWKFNFGYIRHALSFGVPLIPHTLGGIFILITDRFMLTNLMGLKETGIYTVGLQIGMIIGLFATSFNHAYSPWLFEKLNQNNQETKLKIVKFTYLYFILIIVFALLLSFFAPYFLKVFVGKNFQGSSVVILWIALGSAFNGMYYMVANYIFYVYKTGILAWVTFISGIINIPMTYYLVKLNGIIGASQSYMLILFISFAMTWFISAKIYKMPWNILRLK